MSDRFQIEITLAKCNLPNLAKILECDVAELNAGILDGVAVVKRGQSHEDQVKYLYLLAREGAPLRGTREGPSGGRPKEFCGRGGAYTDSLEDRRR